MFRSPLKASFLSALYLTSNVLFPITDAASAAEDYLVNLRIIINDAASQIGANNNPNKGWGFGLLPGRTMGTADLLNNITGTILTCKFQLDTNKTLFLQLDNLTNTMFPPVPRLPITTSLILPSVSPPLPSTSPPFSMPPVTLMDPAPPVSSDPAPTTVTLLDPAPPISSDPTLVTSTRVESAPFISSDPQTPPRATPTPKSSTPDLSSAYMDFVSAIPNLGANLTSLGRSYHREMNAPVYQAVAALQQSLSTLQVAMLEDQLINSQSVIRTIRASGSLEAAKVAWNRFLNLPGNIDTADQADEDGTRSSTSSTGVMTKRSKVHIPGHLFTHRELWGVRAMVRGEFVA